MCAQELEVKSQNYWLTVAELEDAHQWSKSFMGELLRRSGCLDIAGV